MKTAGRMERSYRIYSLTSVPDHYYTASGAGTQPLWITYMTLFDTKLQEKQQTDDVEERLADTHLEDLRESGLSDRTILDAGLATVSPEAGEDYLGYPPGSPCLAFPYPPFRGDPYYRLKPEEPLDVGDGEGRKYLAREGGGNRLYGPLQAELDDIITNPDRELILTEGEKKALKAYQEGYEAVAIPGVWSWKEKSGDGTGGTDVIEELDGFRWKDRTVYLCFDADAAVNEAVQTAEKSLARELTDRGARVLIVRLPSEDLEKVGLDDYLVAEGTEAFDKLLEEAKPHPGTYFQDGFKPVLLAREMATRDNYIYAKDMEEGGGRLHVYRDGVYRPAGCAEEQAQELLGEKARNTYVAEAAHMLARTCTTDIDRLNPDTDLVNVKNGLLNPFTEELQEHEPDYLSTIQIPTAWDPDAESSVLDEFLETTCGDWAEQICRLAGYLPAEPHHGYAGRAAVRRGVPTGHL